MLLGPKGKGLSQREKYLALTVFCRGVRARARARACGYAASGDCPLCGLHDSVRHRAWRCLRPDGVQARADALGADLPP
eukprot:7936648-Pyramimonas_sp.AAC.1